MDGNARSEAGIWKYSKGIIGALCLLFVIAAGVDAVLWYAIQKSVVAQQTLNAIVASQPQPPKTPEDKVKLLDALVAQHSEAVAQSSNGITNATTSPTEGNTSTRTKIKLLNALINK